MARRLTLDGSRLLNPDGSATLLRGFNLAFTLDSPFSVPDKRHGDELFLELLPGTNYVRLVMLHWYDRPTLIGPKGTAVSAGNDCSLGHVRWGEPVISPRCLEQMDTILRWSASQGLWAIVTARCSLAAGEQIPNKYSTNVFGDAEVRRRFLQMWGVVAARYRSFDLIAGYEVLSEPRVNGKGWDDAVRSFYTEACDAVWAADARTPCVIGPAPFYDHTRLESVLLPEATRGRVIYLFNFFVPKEFVMGEKGRRYPGDYRCCDLYVKGSDEWSSECCAGRCCDKRVRADAAALEAALQRGPIRFAQQHNVPIVLDQWGVAHGAGTDRLTYAHDMMMLLNKHGLSWSYWQWRHRTKGYTERTMSIVSSEGYGQKPLVDRELVQKLRGGLNQKRLPAAPPVEAEAPATAPAPAAVTAPARVAACVDTPKWHNRYKADCGRYVIEGHCIGGGAAKGHEWALGAEFDYPERSCCACGKGRASAGHVVH